MNKLYSFQKQQKITSKQTKANSFVSYANKGDFFSKKPHFYTKCMVFDIINKKIFNNLIFRIYFMKKILICLLMIFICQSSHSENKKQNYKHSITQKKNYKITTVKKTINIKKNTKKQNKHDASEKITPKIAPQVIQTVEKKSATQNLGHINPISNTTNNFSVLAVDANTGEILFAKNAHESRYPASLTKLMTLYMIFDRLDKNRLSLDEKIRFSKNASSKPRSKLGVQSGDSITVREAIDALIVLSANDVASAVAEHIAGSELEFGRMMTKKAKILKMYKTNFYNPSGLFHPAQKTTASDMIKLGISLRQNFPQYYKYFSKTNFNFRGREINGHNRITANYPGAEGLKTGYISQSGYNLISSASREEKTIFAAVLGGKTSRERDAYMEKLLNASFSKANGKTRL